MSDLIASFFLFKRAVIFWGTASHKSGVVQDLIFIFVALFDILV